MNILLLTQFLSTTKGGGEYVFSVMADALAKQGHNVWIITHKVENEDYTCFHKNVKIHFVSSIRYEGGLPPSFRDNMKFVLQATFLGLQIVKNEKINIIHSNNFSPALSGSIISSLTLVPHITTVHDVFSLCGKNYWKMWGKQSNISRLNVMLAPFFEKMIIKLKHHAIHTVSEATKDDLIKFGANKPIYVVHNSIKAYNIEKPELLPLQFVYLGRLVFYKNLEVIIRAIQIVRENFPKVTLIVAGDGPHKENLEKLVIDLKLQDNIKFTGFVTDKEKIRLLSTSQALVFPSLCEGFGLVILESFWCNRPALVSNVKPLSDIIEDRKDGLIIDASDEKKWAEAMTFIIQNTDYAKKMGHEGYQKLQQRYNIDSMMSQIESMYNNVISNR